MWIHEENSDGKHPNFYQEKEESAKAWSLLFLSDLLLPTSSQPYCLPNRGKWGSEKKAFLALTEGVDPS